MLQIFPSLCINAFSTSVSSEKMKNKKVAVAGVSLSEAYALSKQHPLSETSARLASQENLKENLPCMCVLSAPLARPMSHLSLLTSSVPDSLSKISLTRAQRENGTKRAFEDKKPLKAEVGVKKGGVFESLAFGRIQIYVRDAAGQGSTKNLSFQEDSRFQSDFQVPRGGGDIPTTM